MVAERDLLRSNVALHRYSAHAQSAVKLLLAEPQNSQPQRQG